MYIWDNWCAAGTGFGWILRIGLLALLLWIAISLHRRFADAGRTNAAVEVLRQRYAKGELSREDYGAMRKTIDF
jgi:putative membrane protein